jgi:hypothetical protein
MITILLRKKGKRTMIQILELFGGIGSPRCALRNIGIPVPIFESIFRKILLGETEERQRGGE